MLAGKVRTGHGSALHVEEHRDSKANFENSRKDQGQQWCYKSKFDCNTTPLAKFLRSARRLPPLP